MDYLVPIKPQEQKEPPIKVDSTLSVAWGLTLILSREHSQNKVGEDFFNILRDIRRKYKEDEVHAKYLDELLMLINGYLRTIAIKREVYFINLKSWESKRDQTIRYWNDLSSLTRTSFSAEGLIVKIASFLGAGSVANLISNASGMFINAKEDFNISLFSSSAFFIGGFNWTCSCNFSF
jgi:hypothetical protein